MEFWRTTGADFLVIGRPIIGSHNPRQAAIDILAEMQEAFDERPKQGVQIGV
jgi:orotidine-5'-phosphate decarboxylase